MFLSANGVTQRSPYYHMVDSGDDRGDGMGLPQKFISLKGLNSIKLNEVVIKFCSKSNVDERGVTLIELCTAIQLIRIDILVQKYLTRENKKYTKL